MTLWNNNWRKSCSVLKVLDWSSTARNSPSVSYASSDTSLSPGSRGPDPEKKSRPANYYNQQMYNAEKDFANGELSRKMHSQPLHSGAAALWAPKTKNTWTWNHAQQTQHIKKLLSTASASLAASDLVVGGIPVSGRKIDWCQAVAMASACSTSTPSCQSTTALSSEEAGSLCHRWWEGRSTRKSTQATRA